MKITISKNAMEVIGKKPLEQFGYTDDQWKWKNGFGRDVKNLLKLGSMVAAVNGKEITAKTVEFVKQFKPTADQADNDKESPCI